MSVNGKIKISTNKAKEGTYTYIVVAKMDDVTQTKTFAIYVNKRIPIEVKINGAEYTKVDDTINANKLTISHLLLVL